MSSTQVTGRRGGSAGLLVIVALAGAGTMVVELSAVRVLAPWFGTSTAVWTNVIGVVLFALSLGYLLGSRLCTRPGPLGKLAGALLAGSVATFLLPHCAGYVAGWFMPRGVTLDRAASLLSWGSLAASFLLFAPAAMALGCVGPLAVEIVQQRSQGHAGTAGGKVLFASTMGSLAGTFGTTHYLLPTLGIESTFLAAAAVLATLALTSWWLQSRRPPVSPALLIVLVTVGPRALGGGYRLPEPGDGVRLLEAVESPYQSVRVVESGEGAELWRQLQVNEGFDSFQSVWQPEPGLLPPSFYYDYFALPPWWSRKRGSWRVMVLGLGAGTAWRVLEGSLPEQLELDAWGAEIDPQVVELARRHMDLAADGPRRHTLADWDARAALRHVEGAFDEIILDTYANQMEIPAHLSSREFFVEAKERLTPGGWLAINIGGFGLEDPVVRAIASTAATAFESEALVVRVPFARNCVAYLRRDAALPRPGAASWSIPPGEVSSLAGPLALEGRWELFAPGGDALLTDDRNPIEVLQQASIAEAAARLAVVEEG